MKSTDIPNSNQSPLWRSGFLVLKSLHNIPYFPLLATFPYTKVTYFQ
jgi:hypothetical protein